MTARLGSVRAAVDGQRLVLSWPLWPRVRLPLLAVVAAVVWPALFFLLAPVLREPWGLLLGLGPAAAIILFGVPALAGHLQRRRAVIVHRERAYEVPRGMLLDPHVARRALPWIEWVLRVAGSRRPVGEQSPFHMAVTRGQRPTVLLLWINSSGLSPIFCEEGDSREQCLAFATLCAGSWSVRCWTDLGALVVGSMPFTLAKAEIKIDAGPRDRR